MNITGHYRKHIMLQGRKWLLPFISRRMISPSALVEAAEFFPLRTTATQSTQDKQASFNVSSRSSRRSNF